MMIKYARPSPDVFQMPVASLVETLSGGRVSHSWGEKRATAGLFGDRDLRPEKNHSLIHLIATGDADYYGGNRNADLYYSTGRKLDLPAPEWDRVKLARLDPRNQNEEPRYDIRSPKTFTDSVLAGNRERAWTFEKCAHVFEEHANKPYPHKDKDGVLQPPDKIYGTVKAAAHNPAMHRVELVIQVPHGRDWDDDLQKIANAQDVGFSIGCRVPYDVCFVKGTLVETSFGRVPIESLVVGTSVRTHTGRYQKMTQRFQRLYQGLMVELDVQGVATKTTMTGNHPVRVVRQDQLRTCWGSVAGKKRRHTVRGMPTCSTCHKAVTAKQEWADASTIQPGDYLVYPVRQSGTREFPDGWAYLLGMYAGDGSIIYKTKGRKKVRTNIPAGISLSLDEDRDVLARVKAAARALLGRDPGVYPAGAGRKGFIVTLHHAEFAKTCRDLIGVTSQDKRIASEVFELTEVQRLQVIGGCVDSDGSADVSYTNNVRFISTSHQLAEDFKQLCWGLDIRASANAGVTTSGFTGLLTSITTVNLGGSAASRVATSSAKASRLNSDVYQQSGMFLLNGYMHVPVQAVRQYQDTCFVYNIGVPGDQSYLVGFAVHNCLHCGHKAESPKNWCEHLVDQLGQLTKEGRFIGVANDMMTYFDISRVRRPADRIAWSLYSAT